MISTNSPNMCDSVPDIEDTLYPALKDGHAPSVEERYYSRFVAPPPEIKSGIGEHYDCGTQVVLLHSNRIALVALHHTHPIMKDNKIIEQVDFQVLLSFIFKEFLKLIDYFNTFCPNISNFNSFVHF